ncbi:MAG: outer membrane protein assembly factor BamD [Candidatus Porifericomitaceae bacterium WSBS_2022_MAG_OTU9]
MNTVKQFAIIFLCALALAACAGKKTSYDGWTAERLYNEAKGALNKNDYSKAKELYQALESRFPLGLYGQQSLLDLAYLYYKSEDSANAISTADRFIELYPQHKYVAYAYYIRGLASFVGGAGFVANLLNLDESQRNSSSKKQTFNYMAELVEKFPDSIYSADARQRMIHLRNKLATHEVNVGNYYMRRSSYLAAANRARYVVSSYPNAVAVPDALAMMVRAYTVLGLDGMAADARKVLQLNHPSHQALAELDRINVRQP